MLLAVAFGWFLSISARMIYPALLPYLRGAYGFTLTMAGALLTALWIAYGLGQLPGGILADRFGERRLLIVSSIVSAGTLALVVLSESVVILFGVTVLFGLGTALYGVSRFTILSEIYPDRIGTATGVTMAAGDIGNSIMPPIAGAIAAAVAWQYGFGFAIPLFVLAAVWLWWTLPSTESSPSAVGTKPLSDIITTLRQPVAIDGFGLLILWGIIFQAVIGFYPTYLIEMKAFSTQLAAILFGGFFALGAVIKPLCGRAYDRSGVRRPTILLMSITAVGLAIFPMLTAFWPIVIATVFVSTVLGYETIVVSNLTRELPDRTQGTGLGALRTGYITLGALSPIAFGALADRGYFDAAFSGLAVLSVITVIAIVVWIDY